MQKESNFFRQKVNSSLCIALISLMCFWTVLYYLGHRAEQIGNSYIEQVGSQLGNF